MFGALQLPDKGCTLQLVICIMMPSEGAAFEEAAKNVIPDSDQIKAAAVKRTCSLSQEGGRGGKVQLSTALSVTKQARPGCGTERRENSLSPKDSRSFHH